MITAYIDINSDLIVSDAIRYYSAISNFMQRHDNSNFLNYGAGIRHITGLYPEYTKLGIL